MLRKLKLGTKLLAVILPPLIVLVAIAGIGARDRLSQAADARNTERYIELAEVSSDLVDNLQWERSLSVFVLSGGRAGGDPLGEQREATDALWERYQVLAEEVKQQDDPLAEAIDRALGRTKDISSFRGSIDTGATDELIINTFFNDAIANHLNVITEVANLVPVSDVSADLATYAALVRAKEAAAQMGSVMTIVLTYGEFDPAGRLWRAAREAEAAVEQYSTLYFDMALPEQAAELRRALNSPESVAADRFWLDVLVQVGLSLDWLGDGALIGEPVRFTESPIEWMNLAEGRLAGIGAVGAGILDEVSDVVATLRGDAEQAALLYLVVTAVAVLLSAVLAVIVARRVTKPLRELTQAADRISTEQLPALVERLRSPSASQGDVLLEPISMRRGDEIGHLADAFDAIQRVTIEVAEEQTKLLRKGIGDIFVNLARRNQTLLDRQIEFIDQLEASEEDPDVLENLFKLDHLATRMRRNAESLLVLAGVETAQRRPRSAPLADVLRVAIGEVEDFARLSVLSLDDAVVTGSAAMDLAHLLSELMENATAYSPPETKVEVLGHRNRDGGYVISVSDQGIGMTDEQFAESNRLLAEPPLVGLTLSRSLGLTVVARLAARLGVDVRLTSSPTGGVTALVSLPESILEHSAISVTEEQEVEEAEPATLASAVPAGAAFEEGLAALMGEESGSEGPRSAGTVASAPEEVEPAGAASGDVQRLQDRTSAGLVRRVPLSSLPVTEGSERLGEAAPVVASQRSPEEVRAMLSRYRSGLRRENLERPEGPESDESHQREQR